MGYCQIMLTAEKHVDAAPRRRGRTSLGIMFGFVGAAIAMFWGRKRSATKIKSPSDALDGFQMTHEDAEMLQRVMDPNNPDGKPKLRAGPARRV